MNDSFDHERADAALQVLFEEGLKFYNDESRADADRYDAIGRAIAQLTNGARNYLQLAYAALEWWNFHHINAVIEWIFPLYGQDFHEKDLEWIQGLVNKSDVEIRTKWNQERGDYDTKRVNVRLVIEEVTDTTE